MLFQEKKMTKDEIIHFLASKKEFMKERYGVLKIGLFGSYARSQNSDSSDIDIAVELKSENKVDNYFGLLHFLEDNLHKKIDLGIESNLKKPIKKYIEKEIIHV
jgi:predicted nucleotidyltransferase